MKIQFIPISRKTPTYSFLGEKITVHHDNQSEEIDISDFPESAVFKGVEPDKISLKGSHIIRNIERKDEELYVSVCKQHPPGGHWLESDWIDSDDYDPNEVYIKEVSNDN